MTFDEQFRPAIDNLTARLRRDIERHLDAAVEELTARAEKLAASREAERVSALEHASHTARAEAEQSTTARFMAERSDAERSFEERIAAERADVERTTVERLTTERQEAERALKERLAAEQADVERATIDRLSAERNAAERAIVERFEWEKVEAEASALDRLAAETEAAEARVALRFRAADVAARERLVRAFRSIDAGQSLSDILDTLASSAVAEAPRVAIFLTNEALCRSWRFQGFEPAFSTSDELVLSNDAAGIIAGAMRARQPLTAGGAESAAPSFADLPENRLAVAIPLIVNGEVVVVLYADEGLSGEVEHASWTATIEILARHASRALEAITAHRLARTLTDRTHARPRTSPRPTASDPGATPGVSQDEPESRA